MSDLVAFLFASVVVSALATSGAFALIRLLVKRRAPRLLVSAGTFPVLMIGLAVYAARFGLDPHGFAMVIYGMIGVASIPATTLTAWLLARRFA
jgi:hypothetical protein